MPENPRDGSDHHLADALVVGKQLDDRVLLLPVSPAPADDDKDNAVIDHWGGAQQLKIPDPFVWSHADTHHHPVASPETELLDAPVVDVGAAMRSGGGGDDDCAAAAELVSTACSSHGVFQVTGHGLDPALARAALDGAADFFRLPLATKQRASRAPGNVTGYATAHSDRFTANLPWKETLSFGHHRDDDRRTSGSGGGGSHVVVDYITSTLGSDFKPLGVVYQEYCDAMKEVSLAIMEVIGVSLGVGRSYYRDFFEDGSSIMRCNYYPPCPEPERTLGTGPHCDPSAITLLLQDGAVDGLQVLVDGEWRTVRPRPGAIVVNIGDTFMALSNGRYRSCLHRAVVHRERERRSLAFFLCPREDRVVRPPPRLLLAAREQEQEQEQEQQLRRRYPDFTWADLARFTQRHYRVDTGTLDAFARWLRRGDDVGVGPGPSRQGPRDSLAAYSTILPWFSATGPSN